MNYMNPLPVPFQLVEDPAADEVYPIFRAVEECEVVSAWIAQVGGTIAGNTTSYVTVTIYDGGSTATGTDTIASRGGASTAWTDATPYTLTISEGTINAGDYVTIKYDEEGTVSMDALVGQLDIVYGLPAGKGKN